MRYELKSRTRWTTCGAILLLLGNVAGCVRLSHYLHRHTAAQQLHEAHMPYFHCSHCGQIVPKHRPHQCGELVQLPYYGFNATCWRAWPSEWMPCPAPGTEEMLPAAEIPGTTAAPPGPEPAQAPAEAAPAPESTQVPVETPPPPEPTQAPAEPAPGGDSAAHPLVPAPVTSEEMLVPSPAPAPAGAPEANVAVPAPPPAVGPAIEPERAESSRAVPFNPFAPATVPAPSALTEVPAPPQELPADPSRLPPAGLPDVAASPAVPAAATPHPVPRPAEPVGEPQLATPLADRAPAASSAPPVPEATGSGEGERGIRSHGAVAPTAPAPSPETLPLIATPGGAGLASPPELATQPVPASKLATQPALNRSEPAIEVPQPMVPDSASPHPGTFSVLRAAPSTGNESITVPDGSHRATHELPRADLPRLANASPPPPPRVAAVPPRPARETPAPASPSRGESAPADAVTATAPRSTATPPSSAEAEPRPADRRPVRPAPEPRVVARARPATVVAVAPPAPARDSVPAVAPGALPSARSSAVRTARSPGVAERAPAAPALERAEPAAAPRANSDPPQRTAVATIPGRSSSRAPAPAKAADESVERVAAPRVATLVPPRNTARFQSSSPTSTREETVPTKTVPTKMVPAETARTPTARREIARPQTVRSARATPADARAETTSRQAEPPAPSAQPQTESGKLPEQGAMKWQSHLPPGASPARPAEAKTWLRWSDSPRSSSPTPLAPQGRPARVNPVRVHLVEFVPKDKDVARR